MPSPLSSCATSPEQGADECFALGGFARSARRWTIEHDACIVLPVDWVFDVATPLGFRVHCTTAQWDRISTIKHPPMRGRLQHVVDTLTEPDEVRRSVGDPTVLLFHRRIEPRWVCAVVRREGENGFLITAYPADKIKQGEIVWTK